MKTKYRIQRVESAGSFIIKFKKWFRWQPLTKKIEFLRYGELHIRLEVKDFDTAHEALEEVSKLASIKELKLCPCCGNSGYKGGVCQNGLCVFHYPEQMV
jgi:hypothetical protein